MELVSQRVHRLPKAPMKVGGELSGGGEPLKRGFLPDRVVSFYKVRHGRLKDEKSTVDPGAVSWGLFVEAGHELSIEGEGSKSPGRLRSRHCRKFPVPRMIIQQITNVDIANTVSVGQAEPFPAKVPHHPLQATARHRLLAGIHQRHFPRFCAVLMDLDP